MDALEKVVNGVLKAEAQVRLYHGDTYEGQCQKIQYKCYTGYWQWFKSASILCQGKIPQHWIEWTLGCYKFEVLVGLTNLMNEWVWLGCTL